LYLTLKIEIEIKTHTIYSPLPGVFFSPLGMTKSRLQPSKIQSETWKVVSQNKEEGEKWSGTLVWANPSRAHFLLSMIRKNFVNNKLDLPRFIFISF